MLDRIDGHISVPPDRGSLQPRGIVLGIAEREGRCQIIAASSSVAEHWNESPYDLPGKDVADLLDLGDFPLRTWATTRGKPRIGPIQVADRDGVVWHATLTRAQYQRLIHLERPNPNAISDGDALHRLSAYMEEIHRAQEVDELWADGANRLRTWIDFDRTLVIRERAGSNEVIAESMRPGLPSLIGAVVELPESDRPLGISSTSMWFSLGGSAEALATMEPATDGDGIPWDLSESPLRTAPASLEQLTAHFRAKSSYVMRLGEPGNQYHVVSIDAGAQAPDAFCAVRMTLLAKMLYSQAQTLRERMLSERRLQRTRVYSQFIQLLREHASVLDAVQSEADGFSIMQLVRADGLVLRLDGARHLIGDVTDAEARVLETLFDAFDFIDHDHSPILVDDLASRESEAAAQIPEISGIMALELGADGSFAIWVRRSDEREALTLHLSDTAPPEECEHRYERTVRIDPWSDHDEQDALRFVRAIEDKMLRSAEAELAALALVDPLTGLPNRRLLHERLSQALKRAGRGKDFMLVFIDLNDFKEVNDENGHLIGDAVLVEVGKRLQGAVRDSDTVARFGGDEFVVLCEDVVADERDQIIARLARAFAAPFQVADGQISLGASLGAEHIEPGDSVDDLLSRADLAMYEAKKEEQGASSVSEPAENPFVS